MVTNKRARRIVDYICIVAGCFIMATAYPVFFIPCHIAPGGVSGIATIINAKTGLPVGMTNLVMCIPLFILSFRALGRQFVYRSLIATILSSVLIDVLPLPPVTDNVILAAIFGGLLLGIGLGFVVRGGATTGGSDMAAALVRKKLPFITMGNFLFAFDFVVITAAAFLFSIEAALFAVVAVFVQSIVIDRTTRGFNTAIAFTILSKQHKLITEQILANLERGVTIFDARGAYSGEETPAILCVCTRTQVAQLKQIVAETDPAAFIIAADVSEVMGEGFARLGGTS